MPKKGGWPSSKRTKCDCGAFVTAGCKKCGRRPSRNHEEVVDRIKTWADRRRVIGHLNAEQRLLVDDILIEVFGTSP